MKVIKLFESDDGLIFDNESLCKRYEEEVAKNPEDTGIIFFDANGHEITYTGPIGYATVYKVTNKIIAEAKINAICIKYPHSLLKFNTNPGCYAYETYKNCQFGNWVEVDEDTFMFLINNLKR